MNHRKANILTLSIALIFGSYGAVCWWKPAYGLIIGLSVAFTLSIICVRQTLLSHLSR